MKQSTNEQKICQIVNAVTPVGFKPTTFRTGSYAVKTRRLCLSVGVSLFSIFLFDGNITEKSAFFVVITALIVGR